MSRSIKHLAAIVGIASALAVPTAADARAIHPAATSGPAAQSRVATATSSSTQGLKWNATGIGAGALLVLVGVGSAGAVAHRRRAHQLLPG
jgi:uncharacterized protein (TIGR03382 family)